MSVSDARHVKGNTLVVSAENHRYPSILVNWWENLKVIEMPATTGVNWPCKVSSTGKPMPNPKQLTTFSHSFSLEIAEIKDCNYDNIFQRQLQHIGNYTLSLMYPH